MGEEERKILACGKCPFLIFVFNLYSKKSKEPRVKVIGNKVYCYWGKCPFLVFLFKFTKKKGIEVEVLEKEKATI